VQHLLHHEETRVPLVVARDSKAKLLVDVDSSLVVVPHVGDDVVHVPLLRLLQHPLHQLLGHPLPPVSVEGANEPEVESVIVGQLATNCSSQHVVPISEEGEPGVLLDELAPLVGGHVGHREDREDLLVDVPEGGEVSSECFFVSSFFCYFGNAKNEKVVLKKRIFHYKLSFGETKMSVKI